MRGRLHPAMFASRVVRGVRVHCAALYVVAVLAIVAYGALLRRTGWPDALSTPLYSHPLCTDVDGWSVTHLFFFFALGLLFPGQHLQFFLVGAGWEVVETVLGQNRLEVSGRRLQLIGDQDAEGRATGKDDAFWYGKQSDIVVDTLGYCLGSAISAAHWPNDRPRDGK